MDNSHKICLFVFLYFLSAVCEGKELSASVFSVEDGLSQYDVSDVVKDNNGFVWVATFDGLNRFNGAVNTIYRVRPDDTTSICHNRVRCLCYDSVNNRLIAGTDGGGLSLYDYDNDRFENLRFLSREKYSYSANDIVSIGCSSSGDIAVASKETLYFIRFGDDGSSDVYQSVFLDGRAVRQVACKDDICFVSYVRSNELTMYLKSDTGYHLAGRYFLPAGTEINSLTMSLSGDSVFVAAEGGIFCARTGDMDEGFVCLTDGKYDVQSIAQSSDGSLYFYDSFQGLFILDPQSGHVENVILRDGGTYISKSIRKIYADDSGMLWMCSSDGGVISVDLLQKQFMKLDSLPDNTHVNRIFYFEGKTYVGTQKGQVYVFDEDNRPGRSFRLPSPVSFIGEIGKDLVAIVAGGKIFIQDATGTFVEKYPRGISVDDNIGSAFSVCRDDYGSFWIGGRHGIMRVKNGRQIYFLPLEAQNQVRVFNDGYNIWCCTNKSGLYQIKLDTLGNVYSYRLYRHSFDNIESLNSNTIWDFDIFDGKKYICTDAGLNIVSEDGKISRLDVQHPLYDVKTLSVLFEPSGTYWVNTTHGIYRCSGSDVQYYNVSDGLRCGALTEALCRKPDGEIYVGGNKGVCWFSPDKIVKNTVRPVANIVEVRIFDVPVARLAAGTEMQLKHNENSMSFVLSSSSYNNVDKNIFRYRLAGREDEWNVCPAKEPVVSYQNLDPGKYVFEVVSVNNDGIAGDVSEVGVTIHPPFYDTVLSRILFTFLLLGIVWVILWYYRKQQILKRALYIEDMRHRLEHEADESKLMFLSNITHEIRTPLSLIAAPLSELQHKVPDSQCQGLISLMQRNVDRLSELVNQFLDLRKIDKGTLPLRVEDTDLRVFLNSVIHRFHVLGERKNIEFGVDIDIPDIRGYVDKDKLSSIIYNLLSNAFKFTPEHGTVSFHAAVDGGQLSFEVRDKGCGIEESDLKNIFNRFYQCSNSKAQGTGIGLDLARRFVDLHKGTIRVESTVGKGTAFYVEIPVEKDFYSEKEITGSETGRRIEPRKTEHVVLDGIAQEDVDTVVLVVEDDDDMRIYIEHLLSSMYKVETAADGIEGYEKAVDIMPDIIISDVMMPRLDGIGLCEKIRNDKRCSHIPVILLTAKNSHIEGLSSGAVDYIMKPFSPDAVCLKVNNIVRTMRGSARRFQGKEAVAENIKVCKSEREKAFLQEVYDIVMKNLPNGDFGVEDLTKELGTSRTQLHRKMIALTGCPASIFIRNVRLDKAKEMIESGKYSIKDVLYAVGYSSPSYFSKTYKERYGVLPSSYFRIKI